MAYCLSKSKLTLGLWIWTLFLCRFEDDKNVSTLFEELWEEYTSGERITLQLYLGEIVSLICESISSSSWASKRKVSLTFLFCHLSMISLSHCRLVISSWCFLIFNCGACSLHRLSVSSVKFWANLSHLTKKFCLNLLWRKFLVAYGR